MVARDNADLQRVVGQLRLCVGSLRERYGDSTAVRRLENDLERLDIDAGEFDRPSVPAQQRPAADRSDVVMVPDTPYDPSLWQGADDEGVGGYQRGER